MSDVKPSDLYRGCERSAFRLETLNRYDVPWEAEDLRAFREDGELLLEEPTLRRWFDLAREVTETGRSLRRVHVLDRPLTPYLQWELAFYRHSIEAGEDVRIAERSWHPALEELRQDFALIDAETDHPTVIWYEYDEEEALLGYRYSKSPADIERCMEERDIALAHAVSLEEFMALLDKE